MASGPREPRKPRPLPKRVRAMISLMVCGDPSKDDARPLDFTAAGRKVGMRPDTARRWLDRGDFRSALRAERRAFRDSLCAGNEAALARVRDRSRNHMAVVRSVIALEQLDDVESARAGSVPRSPGLVIHIHQAPSVTPQVRTIEHDAPVPLPRPFAHVEARQGEPRVPWLDDPQQRE
jgi:hypothetical protein